LKFSKEFLRVFFLEGPALFELFLGDKPPPNALQLDRSLHV
jgi:hypothetical protein